LETRDGKTMSCSFMQRFIALSKWNVHVLFKRDKYESGNVLLCWV